MTRRVRPDSMDFTTFGELYQEALKKTGVSVYTTPEGGLRVRLRHHILDPVQLVAYHQWGVIVSADHFDDIQRLLGLSLRRTIMLLEAVDNYPWQGRRAKVLRKGLEAINAHHSNRSQARRAA